MNHDKLSNAAQESYVAQGLALAVLAQGVGKIPADKMRFEFAFAHAWRRFPSRQRFPRILVSGAADPFYAVVARSERRRGPLLAAWETEGPGLQPYLWNDDWSVEESAEMLSSWTGVPWSDWERLGRDLIAHLRGETEHQ